ncbi:hypothetical protein [Desulforamulus putei]|uniref:hypothetical protein n=1 Tax=Desulforamulus putei TaxID=74701 RepID=UPI0011607EFE|nr:hypothetical protein [Desulforamulus putei]
MDWSYTELSNLVGQFLPHFHFPSIRKTIWLDFSNLDFAKTHVLLMVGCFAKYLQTQRLLNNFYCVIPRKIDVHRYMSRLDFYKMIGANVEELFTRQPSSGRFVEICQTNKDNTFDVVSDDSPR